MRLWVGGLGVYIQLILLWLIMIMIQWVGLPITLAISIFLYQLWSIDLPCCRWRLIGIFPFGWYIAYQKTGKCSVELKIMIHTQRSVCGGVEVCMHTYKVSLTFPSILRKQSHSCFPKLRYVGSNNEGSEKGIFLNNSSISACLSSWKDSIELYGRTGQLHNSLLLAGRLLVLMLILF